MGFQRERSSCDAKNLGFQKLKVGCCKIEIDDHDIVLSDMKVSEHHGSKGISQLWDMEVRRVVVWIYVVVVVVVV